MWQRWWQGVGPCHRGRGKGYGVRPVAGLGAYGRVWGMWQHVTEVMAGCGGMSQG